MFEKIIDIIKVFFEKYFIQALVAVIPTIIIFYCTPDDSKFLVKIGKELYIIFFFVLIFLFILLLTFLFKTIKVKVNNAKVEGKYNRESEEQLIKDLWTYTDSLEAIDKKIIDFFIQNNNESIYLYDNQYNKVLHDLCYNTQILSDGTQKFFNIFDGKEENYIDKGICIYQYKLKEEIYNLLKQSLKKYKKIFNF